MVKLNTVYRDAIINRKKMVLIMSGSKYEQILQKTRKDWTEYAPVKQEVLTAGIDSSFNSVKFQGIQLCAVTAVSVCCLYWFDAIRYRTQVQIVSF